MPTEEKFPQNWFEEFIHDPQFKENLSKLGEFKYVDNETGEEENYKYWTDTRWKISYIEKMLYILSPAFWEDEQLEARFALYCDLDMNLMVYVKK